MEKKDELTNVLLEICNNNNLGKINSIKKQNIGFNRIIYNINDNYLIKICINQNNESGVLNEIKYLKENQNYFSPKLIASDTTKKIIPYIYTIEEKIQGNNLFDIWSMLNKNEKEKCLYELIQILKILHSKKCNKKDVINNLILEYETCLKELESSNIFTKDKINYLKELKNNLTSFFKDIDVGFIHGDIHFNNIIYTNEGLKLVDYEYYNCAPLDREFDSINRMIRNPNGLIKMEIQKQVDKEDYKMIMPFLIKNYSEVCNKDNFENRLLIYDCINSLKWVPIYPDYEQYNDILFNKSKKLIK